MRTTTATSLLDKKFLGTDEVRRRLTDIIEKLPKEGGEIVVTQHGKPKIILMNVESYLELQETLQDLQTPGFIESVHKGAKEIEQGKGLTMAQLKKNLGL